MKCPQCSDEMIQAQATDYGDYYEYCKTCKKELKEMVALPTLESSSATEDALVDALKALEVDYDPVYISPSFSVHYPTDWDGN